MGYLFDSYSDIGGREDNEDSYCVETRDNAVLVSVADGLGGHDSGEVASGIAVAVLKRHFYLNPKRMNLSDAIAEANKLVVAKQKESGTKMKTTIVAAHISDGVVTIANVGDSRGYLFRKANLIFQTVDHSASQMAVNVGEISLNQIRTHSDRNILTRALGGSEEIKVDMVSFSETEFDRMLLCTDGFWEYVWEDEMCDTAFNTNSPEKWLSKMRAIHKQRILGDNDNNTAVAIMRKV